MHTKKAQEYAQILGIRLSITPEDRLLVRLGKILKNKEKFVPVTIFTPNPEIVLLARRNKGFSNILNRADINLPDGFGLVLAGKISGANIPKKVIHGREFFMDLCSLCERDGKSVFLLGDDGVSNAAKKLQQKYPKLKIANAVGPAINKNAKSISQRDRLIYKDNLKHIEKVKPDVLFVGFGAPKQEKWVSDNLDKLPVKIVMVVGGTFDYLNGRVKLPPKWISSLHFEWVWRFIVQPQRVGRIFNAFFGFLWEVIKASFF